MGFMNSSGYSIFLVVFVFYIKEYGKGPHLDKDDSSIKNDTEGQHYFNKLLLMILGITKPKSSNNGPSEGAT